MQWQRRPSRQTSARERVPRLNCKQVFIFTFLQRKTGQAITGNVKILQNRCRTPVTVNYCVGSRETGASGIEEAVKSALHSATCCRHVQTSSPRSRAVRDQHECPVAKLAILRAVRIHNRQLHAPTSRRGFLSERGFDFHPAKPPAATSRPCQSVKTS